MNDDTASSLSENLSLKSEAACAANQRESLPPGAKVRVPPLQPTTTPIISALHKLTSSADADNGLDAFSGQSRSTNMVPFWVHCDFSLSM